MKKLIALVLTALMAFGILAGCSEGQPETPASLYGTWEYKSLGYSYVFNADGTGAYCYGDTRLPFTYTDSGTALTIQYENATEPNVFEYSISGKTLSIADSFGSTVKYEKTAEGAAPENQTPQAPEPTEPVTTEAPQTTEATEPKITEAGSEAVAQWWNGQWYGWWCMTDTSGVFAQYDDWAWDAYATIEGDGEFGHIRVWDSMLRESGTLVNCDVHFNPGYSNAGAMSSTQGTFFDSGAWDDALGTVAPVTIDYAQWDIDPAVSSVSHFDQMLEIQGTYQDPNVPENSFTYYIYLRPWGTDWEDVKSGDTQGCIYTDMMPVYYDQWYLPLIKAGVAEMPESFAAGIAIIEAVTE